MYIDFHTHTFPDKIAERALAQLISQSGVPAYRTGTRDSLVESMKRGGVDVCVVLPVATSARQVPSINASSVSLNGLDHIYHFGAVHPDCENPEEILDGIKAAGLRGIKIHPDYQGVYFDDPRYLRILEAAAKRDLFTVTHAGVDLGYPHDVHCTPDMILHVLDKLRGIIDGKLVLAHMGACVQPSEVLEKLVGKPVYFDTAFVLDRYPKTCTEIIRAHGAERILFATDSPWADQGEYVKLFESLALTEEEKALISYRNAEKLLGIR